MNYSTPATHENRMETQRTRWAEREQAALLALETPGWREKRAIAEAPNTPSETLTQLALTACSIYSNDRADYLYGPQSGQEPLTWKRNHLLFEALAAHPNTPLNILVSVGFRTPGATAAFCRNPVVPFLLLENPGFLAGLAHVLQQDLLREADAPPLFVQILADLEKNVARCAFVAWTARLHVALAPEHTTANAAVSQITTFWRDECAGRVKGFYGNWAAQNDRDEQRDLVEVGLAPSWAAGDEGREPLYTLPFIEPLAAWFRWTPIPGSREERVFLRRIDPQLRQWKLLTRALRLSATPSDLRDLLRDPAYNTSDISDRMKRAVMAHPSLTGELLKEIVGKAAKYEPDMAVHPKSPPDLIVRLLRSDFALARRLARRHPNAPADALEISREAAIYWARQLKPQPLPFAAFVGAMQGPRDTGDLTHRAEASFWTKRMEAVLLADTTHTPLIGDPHDRTGLDLLNYLARDGNRLVRFVAQTRLADPNWRFTWADR